MLGKLLSKASEIALKSRKPAPAPVTPDISRVIRNAPQPQAAPAPQPVVEPAMQNMDVSEDFAGLDEEFLAEPEESPLEAAELETKAETAVVALSDEFEGWMRDDLDKLRAAWVTASAPEASADDYRALYTCAHNIRGAATSYGFPSVSRLCGSLCTLLGETRPGENAALINLHVEACRAAVAAGPQGEGSETVADAVCDALERKVAEKVAATG